MSEVGINLERFSIEEFKLLDRELEMKLGVQANLAAAAYAESTVLGITMENDKKKAQTQVDIAILHAAQQRNQKLNDAEQDARIAKEKCQAAKDEADAIIYKEERLAKIYQGSPLFAQVKIAENNAQMLSGQVQQVPALPRNGFFADPYQNQRNKLTIMPTIHEVADDAPHMRVN